METCGATAAGTTGEGLAGITGFGVGAAEPVVEPRSDKLKLEVISNYKVEVILPVSRVHRCSGIKKVGCSVSLRLAEH